MAEGFPRCLTYFMLMLPVLIHFWRNQFPMVFGFFSLIQFPLTPFMSILASFSVLLTIWVASIDTSMFFFSYITLHISLLVKENINVFLFPKIYFPILKKPLLIELVVNLHLFLQFPEPLTSCLDFFLFFRHYYILYSYYCHLFS